MSDLPLWTRQPLLRFPFVAHLLSVNLQTVHNMVEDGRLDAVQVGGRSQRTHRRIVTASLLAYLKQSLHALSQSN